MFCPECGAEYRAGFTRCVSCNVALVDNLPVTEKKYVDRNDTVVVFTTADANEAALVRSLLEASGVETYMIDEHLSRIDSPLAIIIGGVKIAVPRGEEGLARDVLNEYRGRAGQDPTQGSVTPFLGAASAHELFAEEPVAGADEFRCPHCRALLEPETTVCKKCGREPW